MPKKPGPSTKRTKPGSGKALSTRETEKLRKSLLAVVGKTHELAVTLAFAEREPTRPDARSIIYTAPPRGDEDPSEQREIEEIRRRYPQETVSWTKWFDRYHECERGLRPLIQDALKQADHASPELDLGYLPLDRPSLHIKRCLQDLDRAIPAPGVHGDHPPLEIREILPVHVEPLHRWIQSLGLLVEGARRHEPKAGGRPPSSDPKDDARIASAWRTHRYPTYAALGQELGKSTDEVRKALERDRKRHQT